MMPHLNQTCVDPGNGAGGLQNNLTIRHLRAPIAILASLLVSTFGAPASRAADRGQIRIFVVDEGGRALPATVPEIVSVRVKREESPEWEPPHTVSNQNEPADITNRLALAVDLARGDEAAVGVYLPTGFEILKMAKDVPDCAWQNGSSPVPNDGRLYSLYAPSHPLDGKARQTLIMHGAANGVVCVTFMLRRDPHYSAFAKDDSRKYGVYWEKPWSSLVGLWNVRPDKIVSLTKSSSHTEVQLDVSETVGATIVHFFIGAPGRPHDPSRIQLIKSADAADSGLQWSAITRGIEYDSVWENANFNQAVGADPTWMWGLEVPLEYVENRPDATVLKTPDNVWVPIFSDSWELEHVDNQWDKSQFSPRSPLFEPLSLRIFDGRTEEISLKNIPVPNGDSISQVIDNFHIRSHLQFPIRMKFYRGILWSAFNTEGPFGGLAHRVQIYLVTADGSSRFLGTDPGLGSLEQPWPITGPEGSRRRGHCGETGCQANFDNLRRVVLVYDHCSTGRCGTPEQVVSMHLPNSAPFSAQVKFTRKGPRASPALGVYLTYALTGKPLGEAGPEPPPFILPPGFNNGDGGMGDTVVFSIGTNADLNSLAVPLGH